MRVIAGTLGGRILKTVKDLSIRRWYMEQTLANGWSRNILAMQIEVQAHARHGKARSNFALTFVQYGQSGN